MLVNPKSSNAIENTMNKILALKEDTAANIILAFIILIVIFVTIYLWRMSKLQKTNCSAIDKLYSKINGSITSLNKNDPNCNYLFRDYYIKTAYNCCSTGTYKNDFVSTCALKDILKQGVRGLDFEIYSVNNLPVIATSTVKSNFVKETYNYVPVSEAMDIITNYAFSGGTAPNPMDPIILHFRFKSTNPEMYKILADIFKQYDSMFLGPTTSYENNGKNMGNLKLIDLQKKIIVIVEKSNNSFMENKEFYEYVNITSNSIFMRALTYYSVKNTPDIVELQEFNKQNMTISLPDNDSSNPANPSGIVCRETGVQMTAMRYQLNDVNIQENDSFFNKSGYAFCLKPDRLRYIPVIIPDATPQNPALSFQTREVKADYYSFKI